MNDGAVAAPAIDPEALLAALVLAPATYSRNRFFSLYADPAVRRTRGRASLIRSVVRHVGDVRPDRRGTIVEVVAEGSAHRLTYVVPSLGLRRSVTLTETELSLLRYALERSPRGRDPALEPETTERDRARVEACLGRLIPPLP